MLTKKIYSISEARRGSSVDMTVCSAKDGT
jgi:hypothetical protein